MVFASPPIRPNPGAPSPSPEGPTPSAGAWKTTNPIRRCLPPAIGPTSRSGIFPPRDGERRRPTLSLENALDDPEPPDVVLYGWIGHHLYRNYFRSVWLSHLNRQSSKKVDIPHFEIENDRLVFKGIAGAEAGLENLEELSKNEFALTLKLIEEMNRLCRAHGIPFYLVLLPCADDFITRVILKDFDALDLPYIDLRGASDSYHVHDGHPTRQWHAVIAEAIAEDGRIQSAIESIGR